MGKASKKTEIVLELTEEEAEVLKVVVAQVKWAEGVGHLAEAIYDSLNDVDVDCEAYVVTFEEDELLVEKGC